MEFGLENLLEFERNLKRFFKPIFISKIPDISVVCTYIFREWYFQAVFQEDFQAEIFAIELPARTGPRNAANLQVCKFP